MPLWNDSRPYRFDEKDGEITAELAEMVSGFPETLGLSAEAWFERKWPTGRLYQVRFHCRAFGVAQAVLVSDHEMNHLNVGRAELLRYLLRSFWTQLFIETTRNPKSATQGDQRRADGR